MTSNDLFPPEPEPEPFNDRELEGRVREIFPGASRGPVVSNPGVNTEVQRPVRRLGTGLEAGMATAEYAIATLAAVGFAGLLVVILKSDEVRGFLLNIIRTALSF